MKKVPLKDIVVGEKLTTFLYHHNGKVLHKPNEELKLEHLAIMEECGISTVYQADKDENCDVFFAQNLKKSVLIEDIRPGEQSPVVLYDDTNTVILKEGELISQERIDTLKATGVKHLYYTKDQQELQDFQYAKYLSLCGSELFESITLLKTLEHPMERFKRQQQAQKQQLIDDDRKRLFDSTALTLDPDSIIRNPAIEVSPANIKEKIKNPQNLVFNPVPPQIGGIIQWSLDKRTETRKQEYIDRYEQWVETNQKFCTQLKANQQLPIEQVIALVKNILEAFIDDGYLTLNLINLRSKKYVDRYIESHNVNVCIVSISMGVVLGFNATQLLEIGIGAILHDIGHMLTYKPFLTKEKLDSTEQKKYDEHAILGMAMLKNIDTLPASAPFVLYQHHERCNGSGRILHCMSSQIHDIAKIVSVADEYELQCIRKSPFSALSSVISMTKSGLLDSKLCTSLLIALSLFPLGSLVQLSNGILCKVVGTNGSNFKQPLVRELFAVKDKQLQELKDGNVIDLSTKQDISVVKDIVHATLNSRISMGF